MKKKNLIIGIALGAVIAFAVWLRVCNLTNHVLWYDEILSVTLAESDLLLILKTVPIKFLHYLILKIGLLFGDSIIAIKMPGIVAACLSIIAVFFIGKTLKNSYVGLISSLLLSLAAVHIFYTTEVRYYVFLIFFASLFVISFLKAEKSKKLIWIIPLFISLVTLVLTHVVGIFLVFAFIIYFVFTFIFTKLKKQKRELSRSIFWTGIMIIALGSGFTIWRFLTHQSLSILSLQLNTEGSILYHSRFLGVHGGKRVDFANYIYQFFLHISPDGKLGLVLFAIFFVIGLFFLFKARNSLAVYTVILLILIFFIPLLTINLEHKAWAMRYFLTFFPFWISIIGYGIYSLAEEIKLKVPRLKKRSKNIIFYVVLISLVTLFSFVSCLSFSEKFKNYHVPSNYSYFSLAERLAEFTEPGDMVIFRKDELQKIYYFNGGPGIEYNPGNNEMLTAGYATFMPGRNYVERFIAKHVKNNNDVLIYTDNLIAEDVSSAYQEMARIQNQGNKIWFVTVPSFGDSSISQIATASDNKVSVSGFQIIQIVPKDEIPNLYIPINKAKKAKVVFEFDRTSGQIAERYYQEFLKFGSDRKLTVADNKMSGSIIYPFKFNRHQAETIGRDYYIPKEIKFKITGTMPPTAKITVSSSLDNETYDKLEVVESDDFTDDSTSFIVETPYNQEIIPNNETLYIKIELGGEEAPQISKIVVSPISED